MARISSRAGRGRAGRSGAGSRRQELLGIYLNDHLAGATSGVELARRIVKAQSDSAAFQTLDEIAAEIVEDREALLDIMRTLGVQVRRYKVYAGWAAEKAGRLKFNGQVLERSPLSDLLELETLRLGVEGKAEGWRVLRAIADGEGRLDTARLDGLLARAQRQSDILEDLHLRAAERIRTAA